MKGCILGSKPKAFTLIELVIVLTILAIVAAVAIPVFQNLQTQARDSAVRGAVGGVREAISIYRSNEAVEGRPAPYPVVGQVCDVQDNGVGFCTGTLTPKIMENGDLPPNPWARLWNSDPNVDPDSVIDAVGAARGTTNPFISVAWGYKPSTGEFWANSVGNGGDADCAVAPFCTNPACDQGNLTENCY